MADELREWFNLGFYKLISTSMKRECGKKAFDQKGFMIDAGEGLGELALKERMTRAVALCGKYLPGTYRQRVKLLKGVANDIDNAFTTMFLPEFISTYGLDDFDFSMQALKFFTPYCSSEFAIRFFLREDFQRSMVYVRKWAVDKDEHVRRLASEGTRPRLPWSFHLKNLIVDPTPAYEILECLKADKAIYVRKSVANHLNDISKDHPELMLDWVGQWEMENDDTAWIVKRAARTLIKQGHPRSFKLFGFTAKPQVKVVDLRVLMPKIQLGDPQKLMFIIKSEAKSAQKLAVDYKVHYMKKNGKQQPKVFKLKELTLEAGETLKISKSQLFKDMSTRKHYYGSHTYEVIVNGKSMGKISFELCD